MQKPLYHHLPNLVTLMSLVTGSLAIILAFQPQGIHWAPWLIVLCAVFDFLDGFLARLLKAYSELGKQLDSLADVVSFGVAPGIIAFQLLQELLIIRQPGFSLHNATIPQYLILAPAVIFPAFSALRLAKFNIDTRQQLSFIGLPTPGAALFVIFYILAAMQPNQHGLHSIMSEPLALSILLLFLGFLMVSPMRMLSLKFSNWKFSGNVFKYLLVLSTVLSIIGMGPIYGALLSLLFYLLLSAVFHLLTPGTE